MPNQRQPRPPKRITYNELQETASDPPDDRAVGANLRTLRERKGLSQVALARAMVDRGLSVWRQTTVSRVEKGDRPLYVNEMSALDEIVGPGLYTGTRFGQSQRKIKMYVLLENLHRGIERQRAELDEQQETLRALYHMVTTMDERPLDDEHQQKD